MNCITCFYCQSAISNNRAGVPQGITYSCCAPLSVWSSEPILDVETHACGLYISSEDARKIVDVPAWKKNTMRWGRR